MKRWLYLALALGIFLIAFLGVSMPFGLAMSGRIELAYSFGKATLPLWLILVAVNFLLLVRRSWPLGGFFRWACVAALLLTILVYPANRLSLRMMGLYPLTDPSVVSAQAADLQDDELVLGVVVNGRARAYPFRILEQREIVNDRIGSAPLLVSH